MGKKRKAAGRSAGDARPGNAKDESKLRITTFEDVADEQDEFLLNRDKVLLDEGPAAKRLRKWKEQDEFLEASDEEVLGYSSGDDEDEDDLDAASKHGDGPDDAAPVERGQDTQDEDEDAGGWGTSRKDYYNADAIETEQDALDEEAEARRIQKKQLQAMDPADFGFDEDEWLGREGADGSGSGTVVTEVLPQLHITDDMTEAEKLKILKMRYPEFEFISKEYLRLQPLHDELAAAANAAERLIRARAAKSSKSAPSPPPTSMAVTKYRACAAYLAAMAMYFAILGSTAKEDGSPAVAMDPAELHEHAVMESLLKCQGVWAKVESLPVADPMVEASHGDELSVIDEAGSVTEVPLNGASTRKKKEKKERQERKSKAEMAAEAARATAAARRAEKLRKTEEELAGLSSLTDKSALRKAARQKKDQPMLNLLNADDSDFGEETALTAHELAEKARKKKSLRFYTSQIVQKVNKREAASRDYGGDADVPHRERLRDRQARLQAEAEKRGQNKTKGPGVALGDGGESGDDSDHAQPRGGASADADEGYYDMIAARGTAKKAARQEAAAAYALAAREGGQVVPQEVIGDDGKRKISYMIEKNKGLTPHRKKIVRNPRVKKKLKFEQKKKKLKSQRAVYSGGEAKGGYAGELTGIKKGLVRSTKL